MMRTSICCFLTLLAGMAGTACAWTKGRPDTDRLFPQGPPLEGPRPEPAPPPIAGVPRVAHSPLHIRFLGVGGFMLESAGDRILTVPLYTRPGLLEVAAGSVASDAELVVNLLPDAELRDVRAILGGHAHYDHLLDLPAVLARAPRASFYGNRAARNILAAYAPDRSSRCAGTAPARPMLARSRVVALDDPALSFVDYTYCPSLRPRGAPLYGTWLQVPGAHARVMAFCSEHPRQLGPIHYAAGTVAEEQCAPPRAAVDWREGTTLAYLIDFTDPASAAPLYRVYYQDAPTNAPLGHVPPAILAEKRIDAALLCVGAYGEVNEAPTATLEALQPRYAIGGHWENFFRAATDAPQPIPLLDVSTWIQRARAALPTGPADHALVENGAVAGGRVFVPRPGDQFEIIP